MRKKIGVIFLLLGIFCHVSAHGDLDARILKVSEEISTSPDSAFLFFKRGKLYYQHEEYDKSLVDLEACRAKGYSDNFLTLYLAKANHKLGFYDPAISYVESILAVDSQNVLAFKIMGTILMDKKDYESAALAFENVILYSQKTFPENYIDAAISWESLNSEKGLNNAYEVLSQGIERIGPLVTIYTHLVDLSIRFDKFDRALEYQEKIITSSNRKESALYKQHEIFLLADNKPRALDCLSQARTSIDNLPARSKNTSAMKLLLENILEKESALNKTPNH